MPADRGPILFLSNALAIWILSFVGTLIGVSVANGLFRIPFGSVADVLLALQITFFAVIAISAVLTSFESISTFLLGILSLALSALLPFSAIAGLLLYQTIVGADLTSADLVYLPTVSLYLSALARLGLLSSEFISTPDPLLRGLVPVDAPDEDGTLYIQLVVVSLIALSLVFSAVTTRVSRAFRRRRLLY